MQPYQIDTINLPASSEVQCTNMSLTIPSESLAEEVEVDRLEDDDSDLIAGKY